jgi:hypothetical protein
MMDTFYIFRNFYPEIIIEPCYIARINVYSWFVMSRVISYQKVEARMERDLHASDFCSGYHRLSAY